MLKKLLLEIDTKISNLQKIQKRFSEGRAPNQFSAVIADTVEYVYYAN